jgi:hypothetical protein
MKGTGQTPAAATTGSVRRKVSTGRYVGVLANKFHAGYKCAVEEVDVAWTATTVAIKDTGGTTIREFAKPTEEHG